MPAASTPKAPRRASRTPTALASLPISRACTATRSTNAMPSSARFLSICTPPGLLACSQPPDREADTEGRQHGGKRLGFDGALQVAYCGSALLLDGVCHVGCAGADFVEQRFGLFHELGFGRAGSLFRCFRSVQR